MSSSEASAAMVDEAFNVEPEVKSPCTGICSLDEHDICVGCGRSRQDLRQWSKASADEQRAQVARAKVRLAAMLIKGPTD